MTRIHLMAARIILINSFSLLVVSRYLHCVVSFREGNEKSYQLLRDSLDLYLTINPDNVQYLLLQARLYFHLGIWPEKVRTQPVVGNSIINLLVWPSDFLAELNSESN